MDQRKITSRPPQLSRDQFIQEANNKRPDKKMPWDDCRSDVKKAFTVSLPEAYIAKLQFIKEHTNRSQQSIVRDAVCKEIDAMIMQLLA